MNDALSEYIERRKGMAELQKRAWSRNHPISDGGAVLILGLTFLGGCLLGTFAARKLSPAASEQLRTGLEQYVAAARDGTLRLGFWQSLRELLPWTVLAIGLTAFVSCGMTLPLLFACRGCTAACAVASVLQVRGLHLGLYTVAAVCGIRNLTLLLALATVTVPNFARTLRRERLRGPYRFYAVDRTAVQSAWMALLLTLVSAAADILLTPALTALLPK